MHKTQNNILISGWGAGRDHMETLAERLGLHDFQALSLRDLYERGTAVSASDEKVSVYSRGLAQVLAEDGEAANVIGWSTGGVIALETAERHADRFQRLVLLSTTPKFCADEHFPHGTPHAALRAMIHGIRQQPEQTVRDFLVQAAAPLRMDDEQLDKHVAEAMVQGKDLLVDGLKYLAATDACKQIPHLQIPSLVIHGRKDRIVPWRAAEWLNDQLPQAEFLLYPRGGHLLLAQHGNEIVPRIKAFIQTPNEL